MLSPTKKGIYVVAVVFKCLFDRLEDQSEVDLLPSVHLPAAVAAYAIKVLEERLLLYVLTYRHSLRAQSQITLGHCRILSCRVFLRLFPS